MAADLHRDDTTGDLASRVAWWAAARVELDGLPGGGGLNIAHECVDRHAADPFSANRVALRAVSRAGRRTEMTYAELAAASSRFANLLSDLGVTPGETLFTLLGRTPELYVSVLGALKALVVVSPLFAAFGPEPVRQRLVLGDATVLVTTESLYRRRIEPIRHQLPTLRHVLLVGEVRDLPAGTTRLNEALAGAASTYTIAPTPAEHPSFIHFTSGTTGTPKGAVHVHEAVVAHHATGVCSLDLRATDTYWCTADPGWVTGTSYGIVAPLSVGATVVVDDGGFDPGRWYDLIEAEKIDVWYTAPTALRMLMRAGPDVVAAHDLSSLRHVACVGEPLNAEVVRWAAEVLGVEVHDTWWQTETGAIMVHNPPGVAVVPGAMGVPIAGVEIGIVDTDDGQRPTPTVSGPAEGQLAIRAPWPSMFRDYVRDHERYESCFVDGWYLSGDLVQRDEAGRLWFVGRADDVIKSAGHLVGPFEVESVLIEHPSVAEAAVIGAPDPVAGEIVKAFVVLNEGDSGSDELLLDLMALARRRLGPAVAPRQIVVVDDLPHTRSGKVMRRLLKARDAGLPEGDLSTLEPPPGTVDA
jgi:acetyl-CoA synthetase